MRRYMIVHRKDPELVSNHINMACKICAKERRANWKRAYFNLKEGCIFCEWEATDKNSLEKILEDSDLPCKEIVEVDVIKPEECSWDIFGEMEE
ncbi:MAG: DUF4242 domain-containing protein [Thermodesulfobacteriota bacterium]|nr:DUF4242 domain-containing protein [Thermodesulfobacteriota bacterium]